MEFSNWVVVPVEVDLRLARFRIPNCHHLVLTTGDNVLFVGSQDNCVDRSQVGGLGEVPHSLPSMEVDDLEVARLHTEGEIGPLVAELDHIDLTEGLGEVETLLFELLQIELRHKIKIRHLIKPEIELKIQDHQVLTT